MLRPFGDYFLFGKDFICVFLICNLICDYVCKRLRALMDSETGLALTNILLGGLFLISEVIGASKCQANGVVDFMVHGLSCFNGNPVRVRFEEVREPVAVVV
jgi:hypothetical protein